MLTPDQKKDVRSSIADFCAVAEQNQLKWHYTQARPFRGFDVAPHRAHANDCSGYVSLAFHWAMHEVEVFLADPLGYRYSGWGYTGSQLDWLEKNGSRAPVDKYLIGDMAIWGHSTSYTTHTAICRKKGDAQTSVWSSHGNEGAPDPVKLGYHPHKLLGAWRHPALR